MGLHQLKRNATTNTSRWFFASGKEIYLHEQTQVGDLPATGGGINLEPGEHSFTFNVNLPGKLPSSFRGSHGYIKYKMRFIVRKAWSLDERYTIPFMVRKRMLLTMTRYSEAKAVHGQASKHIMLACKFIDLFAMLPLDYAICGESLRICVNIFNESIIMVEKLRFSLIQQIVYHVNNVPNNNNSNIDNEEGRPSNVSHRESIIILTKETGPVHKRSERNFAHLIQIPYDTLPTDMDCSSLIKVSYIIRVEALLRGFFKNLVTELPFTLYSRRTTNVESLQQRSTLNISQHNSINLLMRSASLQSGHSLAIASPSTPTNSSGFSQSYYEFPSPTNIHHSGPSPPTVSNSIHPPLPTMVNGSETILPLTNEVTEANEASSSNDPRRRISISHTHQDTDERRNILSVTAHPYLRGGNETQFRALELRK